MRVGELRLIFAHDRWATERVLGAAATLSAEQFRAPGEGGHAPLRETLLHSLDAQRAWRSRAQGAPPATPIAEEAFPTVAALRQAFEAEWAEMAAALDAWQDADLVTPVQWSQRSLGQRFSTPPWQMLYHALHHSTQHRSEVAETLTLLGQSPGDLDFGSFLYTQGIVRPLP